MIARLTGTVVEVTEEWAIVERDGLGYEVLFPAYLLGQFTAAKGREVALRTIEFIEGGMQSASPVPRLIGFLHASEVEFFHLFLRIRGIGPRKALRALARPISQIAAAIEAGDAKELTQLPEVGKRTAQQMITDLQGKLDAFALAGAEAAGAEVVEWTPAQRQALEILTGPLGERRADAEQWLKHAAQANPELETPEEWVRATYAARAGAE